MSNHSHSDGKDGEAFYVCSLCDCPLKTHYFFVHCPLLENELICIDCCQGYDGVADDKIIENFKELGKDYTREQIDSACNACGNRCPKGEVTVLPDDVVEDVEDKEKK